MESSIDESMISKDVTLLISRIGDIKTSAKVKWMDFIRHHKVVGDNMNEYRVKWERFYEEIIF